MEITTITLIITTMVAGIVAYIGFLQYRTSKRQQEVAEEKLKLDLFDKRFKVFEATRNLIVSIMQSGGEVDSQPIKEFAIKTIDKAFLFDDVITKYLKEVDNKAIRLIGVTIKCNGLPVGAELDREVSVQKEITNWFDSQYLELETIFAPYLKFKIWK